jgi:hypothetical protein
MSAELYICNVKYIHLKENVPQCVLHGLEDYELKTVAVAHQSFEHLHALVVENCPCGYVCVDPIELHHEVLWESSLRVSPHPNGHFVIERDRLFHPIYDEEYMRLWHPKVKAKDWHTPISVCVEVKKSALA